MKKRTKIILLVVLGVLVVLGGVGYYLWYKADQETKEITTAKKTEQSQKMEVIHETTDVAALKAKLGSGEVTDRIAAAARLVKLDQEKNVEAGKLLEEVSKDEKQDAKVLALVNEHFAAKMLAGKQGADRDAVLLELLKDPRDGMRLKALLVLEDGTDASKAFIKANAELLKSLAKDDKNEYVRIQADSIAGGGGEDEGGEEEGGDEEEPEE